MDLRTCPPCPSAPGRVMWPLAKPRPPLQTTVSARLQSLYSALVSFAARVDHQFGHFYHHRGHILANQGMSNRLVTLILADQDLGNLNSGCVAARARTGVVLL